MAGSKKKKKDKSQNALVMAGPRVILQCYNPSLPDRLALVRKEQASSYGRFMVGNGLCVNNVPHLPSDSHADPKITGH